jgi:hypothetical protein
MLRRLDQLRALASWERRLLVRLVLLLPAIGAALRMLGFKRTRDLLARLAGPQHDRQPAGTDSANDRAQRIARLVAIAAHHGLYRATCLRQSLALWWLLRRRHIPAELRIGVRKDGGELQAHAWVELAGQPVNDAPDVAERLAPFDGSLSARLVSSP